MGEKYIVDSHSHIGLDNAWDIEGTLSGYIKNSSKLGVRESLLMPVPMPIIKAGKYKITPIMLGTYGDENYVLESVMDENNLAVMAPRENPYKYVNHLLYHNIKNTKNSPILMHFVPLIHPVLDSIEYLEEVAENYHPAALKLHGYSSIISPKEIEDDFLKSISRLDIPLIVHTDCDTSNSEPIIDTFYRNENSPKNWIQILERYQIRGYITHGARLCEESIKLVNKSPYLVIGLGPDKLLSNCKGRMYSNDRYLETLFTKVDIDKICFDLDYPWNVNSYDERELEWNSLTRIEQLKLSDTELEKVLCKNAEKFFKL